MAVRRSRVFALASGLGVLSCSPAAQDENGNTGAMATPSSQDRNPNEFPAKPERVTNPAEIKSSIAAFDEHLMAFGQRVRSCDPVVRISIGKDSPAYGRGLATYGAYCTLASGEDVALCYEEAVGRLALVAGTFVVEQEWLEAFTLRTCADLS